MYWFVDGLTLIEISNYSILNKKIEFDEVQFWSLLIKKWIILQKPV